jgi:hypothetical protein
MPLDGPERSPVSPAIRWCGDAVRWVLTSQARIAADTRSRTHSPVAARAVSHGRAQRHVCLFYGRLGCGCRAVLWAGTPAVSKPDL